VESMTQRTSGNRNLGVAVACVLLATPTATAFAQGAHADASLRASSHREILIAKSAAPDEASRWLRPPLELDRKSGFAYSRNLKMGNRSLVFRIKGPYLRKQNAFGLAFKIDF
jgi:hypothetical protein